MKRKVVFVDTSVLVEVLRIPGKSQRPEAVQKELRERTAAGESIVLPTAAIIETGNHIAQLENGTERRTHAEGFAKVLESTIAQEPPWVFNGAPWDKNLLTFLCHGPGGCAPLADMASQGIGVGDVSILAEAAAYRARVAHVDVQVWTLERGLAAYT
jgi:hypothetical protein